MFVTNWNSTTKIQKISEITNFFRHYFLSRTEVNYTRGYEDGYDDCCSDHDCSYNDYHDSGYCDRDEYEGIKNDECYDDNCGW